MKDVFRGGIVIGGGNSKVDVQNVKIFGENLSTGIDIEVEESAKGYRGSIAVDVTMKNVELDSDLDIGFSGGSTFYGENIKLNSPPFRIFAHNSKVYLKNSEFTTGFAANCFINLPGEVIFDNCLFIVKPGKYPDTKSLKKEYDLAAFKINWYKQKRKGVNQLVHLKNSKILFQNAPGTYNKSYSIISNFSPKRDNNLVLIENTQVVGEFDSFINIRNGGNINIKSSEIESASIFKISNYSNEVKINVHNLKTILGPSKLFKFKKTSLNSLEFVNSINKYKGKYSQEIENGFNIYNLETTLK